MLTANSKEVTKGIDPLEQPKEVAKELFVSLQGHHENALFESLREILSTTHRTREHILNDAHKTLQGLIDEYFYSFQ